MCRRLVSSTIRSITAFCVVTSSAGGRLVRDQELRIAGQRQRDHDALAHAAREFERIGVIALAGTGDLDLLQRLDRFLAAVGDGDCCTCWRSTSSIWSPTFRIGLSAARGFWKIIEISRPRRSRISFSLAALTSMPENITEPSAILPARSRIRITAYDVTDLPEPDSPTMPSVSPLPTEILTCCTAFTMPRRVVNSTVRSSASTVYSPRSYGERVGVRGLCQRIQDGVELAEEPLTRSASAA